jgi:hypothetical protein
VSAIQYPYVLAFEPTFVEIRHVETGAMAQIIQGSNLRLLFADMPPSTMHSAATATAAASSSAASSAFAPAYNPYAAQQQPQGQFNPYAGYGQQQQYAGWAQQGAGAGYGANGYGAAGQYAYGASAAPAPPPKSGFGRDEIVLVSDDRVMLIHLGAGAGGAPDGTQADGGPLPPLPAGDAVSVYSVAR